MSDFDFDELDRAVSGALNGTPTPSTPSQASSSASAEPTQSPVTPAASPSAPSSTPTPAPASRRSAGRFMDMVHPASDMLSSRPETTLREESEIKTALPQPSFDQPVEELSATEEPSKPLESPFLPDAKVEKRPLGGVGIFPPESPVSSSALPEEKSSPEEPQNDAHIMPDPIDFALQNQPQESVEAEPVVAEEEPVEPIEPVSVEKEAPVEPPALPESDSEAQLEERLANIESETAETIELPSEVDTTHAQPETPPEPTPPGPASITQQYQEQPSSTQESGAIFDTEAYHQPLMHHPVKKKSGMWTILWILILVLVGAGAGVAFYLYILPTL